MDEFVIRQLADQFAEVFRRLAALETHPRANQTSVEGGQTRWLDDNGGEAVVIGLNSNDDPTLRAWNDDGTARVLDIAAGVMRAPIFSATWQRDLNLTVDANGRPLISSGTYTAAWSTFLYLGVGRIALNAFLNLGAGVTSAAARITATLLGIYEDDGTLVTAGGGTQTVIEWTGVTGSGNLSQAGAPWPVPDAIRSPAASPVGAVVQLLFEGRVSGGAGNIWIGPSPVVVS